MLLHTVENILEIEALLVVLLVLRCHSKLEPSNTKPSVEYSTVVMSCYRSFINVVVLGTLDKLIWWNSRCDFQEVDSDFLS